MAMANPNPKDLAVQVVEKLKGFSNFDSWRFCIKLIFEERGLLSVVTSDEQEPGETVEGRKGYMDRRAMIIYIKPRTGGP
jgi:hypothetical protein